MELLHIPLSNLKVATINVRHGRKPPDVSDILPSIRARGVLQPLLVRRDGRGFEIVAGRRYFAASKIAEEQGLAANEVLLPCAVTVKGDDAGAMEASLIENVARVPMDELQEYEAFAKLLKQGRGVADIAKTFGVTELHVKQRLALANLHTKIKEAYRNGDIEQEDLQLLTAASRQQQKEWVAAFDQGCDPDDEEAEGAPRGYELKQWLFGGEQIATGAALFPLEDYRGEIVADLFGDVSCFADRDAFWVLQNAAIARLRDELSSKGWGVSVLEKGERFQAWQHVETPKKDGGRAFIEISETGAVEVHEGYLARGQTHRRRGGAGRQGPDEQGADEQGTSEQGTGGGEAAPAKTELTKAAQNYLALHRHAVVRAELLSHPATALRLAVALMIAGSPLWSIAADPQRADKETIAVTVAASEPQATFEAARQSVLQLLDMEPGYLGTLTRGNADPFWGVAVFAKLLTLSDDAVLRVLTLVMAETLAAGSALVEAAGAVIKPDVARWWRADDVFLGLVRDRVAVNAMLSEVAGRTVADANVSETAKVQKKILRDCLECDGRERIQGWVPRYMAFPVGGYDADKTLQIVSDWDAIKSLFTRE
jgi:ParB family transcriptional regulator, chromosome partitioning protein